jgi:hypothetical protein
MQERILIVPSTTKSGKLLATYFQSQGYASLIVTREASLTAQPIVVEEDAVFIGAVNVLENTAAAIILDGGYMWPQPVLEPTPEEWAKYHTNLDEYLRNEREASSLWFSLLGILNQELPLCINPQQAFEAYVFKVWAFEELKIAGVVLPPYLAGNDWEQIDTFITGTCTAGRHRHILNLPLAANMEPGWLEPETLLKQGGAAAGLSHVTNHPLFLESLSSREAIRVVAVGGEILWSTHTGLLPPELVRQVPVIQQTLAMPLAELTFRYADWLVLSDFSPSFDLAALPAGEVQAVCAALQRLIRERV